MREPPAIEGYGGGGFRVDGLWRPGSLLIVADSPADWPPKTIAEVTLGSFQPVLDQPRGALEFVLFGTGDVQARPSKAIRDGLAAAGLGLEFMATEAAARLHNVLAEQGRLFATALIAI